MKATRQVGKFKVTIGNHKPTGCLVYQVYQNDTLVTTYAKSYWESGRDALKNAIAKAESIID